MLGRILWQRKNQKRKRSKFMQKPDNEGEDVYHVIPDTETDTKEHVPNAECWCLPELFPYDPETEHKVYVHRYLN